MHFHYALVDDLIPREEFERRVEAKIEECGDLVDDPTAAMMVVGELGRAHVKIRGLQAKSSLFSFFGKVIDKTDPRVFDRQDGEKGAVATLLLGDETGSVRVVLWDQRAGAAEEVAIGDVLEVIGRHPGKNTQEIYALALRKASCQIECSPVPGGLPSLNSEPVDLDVVLLAVGRKKTYTRRDGTSGEYIDALAGDAAGTARLIAWEPGLIGGYPVGVSIHITGAKPGSRGEGRGYSLDERSTVNSAKAPVSVPFTPLNSVPDRGIWSVSGTIVLAKEPRPFTTRNGNRSWVRNIVIGDGNATLKVVLWGDHAHTPLEKGTLIHVYHGMAKPGRYADIELHAGRDSVISLPGCIPKERALTGTALVEHGEFFLDTGDDRYLLEGADPPFGQEIAVTGTVFGNKIQASRWEAVPISITRLKEEILHLRELLGSPVGRQD